MHERRAANLHVLQVGLGGDMLDLREAVVPLVERNIRAAAQDECIRLARVPEQAPVRGRGAHHGGR